MSKGSMGSKKNINKRHPWMALPKVRQWQKKIGSSHGETSDSEVPSRFELL
jgi:hypothetical protein